MTSVYEIVSACRMCGVGAGYKLPIIQSIFVGLEVGEIELKQKIKECLQLEVAVHDRMPPLICELCADTIHDFYEFRKMCHETNKRTRLKLGLPLEPVSEPKPVSGERTALNSDSDESVPLSRHQSRRPGPKSAKMKKHLDSKPKVEAPIVIQDSRSPSPAERRETRPRRAPSPKRLTRNSRTDDLVLAQLEDTEVPKPSPRSRPGPLSRKERGRQQEVENLNSGDESDNSLLVPSLKRPREVSLETSIKRARLSSDPPKQEKTTKAGPKSSKDPKPPQKPPPKPEPKSKKRETSPLTKPQKPDPVLPAPKSRKSDIDANKSKKPDPVSKSKSETPKSKSETPKSKSQTSKSKSDSKAKLEVKPELVKLKSDFSSASKSRRMEESSGPASKTKRTESSAPGPRSRKLRDLTPKPPEKVPERPPTPTIQCNICGVKLKTINGLSSHLRTHVPNLIQPKQACNACELWFATIDESTAHHRTHTVDGVPYTCNKCYDDFRSTADYDMHFVLAQCIATYEVPDVKCDECWRLFPTYRLLEGHRCGGEGARPGGKCVNCHRNYATQKSLTTHEMRCTPRKKAEPETEEVSSRDLLPMRVRIVRCDALLQRCGDGCDVSALTRKFGLDPNSVYPYLSMTPLKENNTSFRHMVSIRDEIKMEYLKDYDDKDQSLVHWDSDDDSDDAKSVDSLSNMSLKTLFSPKCLGKVPRKKRDLETSKKSNSSLGFHEDFSNKIIGDIVKESNKDYDSDSILDTVTDDKEENTETGTIEIENSNNSKEIDKHNDNETECNNVKLCNMNDDSDKVNTISSNNEINSRDESTSDSCDLMKANNEQLKDDNLNQTDESKETESSHRSSEDYTSANYDQNASNNIHQSNENHKTSPKNGHLVQNNENESLEGKDEFEGNLSEWENSDVDHKPDSYKEDVHKSVGSDAEMNETQLVQKQVSNKDNEAETSNFSATHDIEEDNVKTVSDNSETHVDSKTNRYLNKSPFDTKDDANENVDTTKIKDDTLNFSQSNSQNDDTGVEFPLPDADNATATTEPNLVDSKDSLITENELYENVATRSVDKFNINFLDEEERLLMAELDAQIGENSGNNVTQNNVNNVASAANENTISDNAVLVENSAVISENRNIAENGNYYENNPVSTENFIEKNVTLDAILNKQNDLDLDSISSEDYNFDI